MINYISVRYEQHRGVEGWREEWGKGGIIHNYQEGECCYSCGMIWCGRQGIRWEMSPLPTPQPTDLFQGQRRREVGGIVFWHSRFGSRKSYSFSAQAMSGEWQSGALPGPEWARKFPGAIVVKELRLNDKKKKR